MRTETTEQLAYRFKAHPTIPFVCRSLSVKHCTLFSYGTPLVSFLPLKRAFLILAEPPAQTAHGKATYIARHLYEMHEIFPYALHVPHLLPTTPTPIEIHGYHNEKLIAANQTHNNFLINKHSAQLRILNEIFPPVTWNNESARTLQDTQEEELAAAEAAGFISLPLHKPPLKDYRATQTHDTSYGLLNSYITIAYNTDSHLRYNKLHKGANSTALFYGKQQIAYYSEQSNRFYILVDHNDPKILAVLRELHSIAHTHAARRTVLLPNFDSPDPETNQRIFNRHLIGIAHYIVHYTRDCSGARDTARRFKTIRNAAVRYFKLTNASEEPFMPDDPYQLAALRRYGAFRTDNA
jgi:hypothetical protein